MARQHPTCVLQAQNLTLSARFRVPFRLFRVTCLGGNTDRGFILVMGDEKSPTAQGLQRSLFDEVGMGKFKR